MHDHLVLLEEINMCSDVIIIDPRTDGAEVRKAEITLSGAWVVIACKDIVIRVQADDINTVAGDEGHG